MKIRDMIFVKTLEKKLGRKLTEEEMNGEEFEAYSIEDGYRWYQIPLLDFPFDLITKPEDISPDTQLPYAS